VVCRAQPLAERKEKRGKGGGRGCCSRVLRALFALVSELGIQKKKEKGKGKKKRGEILLDLQTCGTPFCFTKIKKKKEGRRGERVGVSLLVAEPGMADDASVPTSAERKRKKGKERGWRKGERKRKRRGKSYVHAEAERFLFARQGGRRVVCMGNKKGGKGGEERKEHLAGQTGAVTADCRVLVSQRKKKGEKGGKERKG